MFDAIYKYTFPAHEVSITLQMPAGAKVLSVHEQEGKIALWTLVNNRKSHVKRQFLALSTGTFSQNIEDYTYIGTVQVINVGIVVHIFEYKNDEVNDRFVRAHPSGSACKNCGADRDEHVGVQSLCPTEDNDEDHTG